MVIAVSNGIAAACRDRIALIKPALLSSCLDLSTLTVPIKRVDQNEFEITPVFPAHCPGD